MELKSKIKEWKLSKIIFNKKYNFNRKNVLAYLPKSYLENAYTKISKWNNYSKTPLISLNKVK